MTPRFHTDERLSQCKCGKSHWEFPNSGESTVPEMACWNCEDFHFSFFGILIVQSCIKLWSLSNLVFS